MIPFAWGRCRGSLSASIGKGDFLEAGLDALGMLIAFMASAKLVPAGLAEIGLSIAGASDDLAEKNGCSISL